MKPINRKLLYAGYIVGTALFFLYTLFPSDNVKAYIQYQIGQMVPDVSVAIEDVKPAFPPGLKFLNLQVLHREETVLDTEKLSISPGLWPLLTGRLAVNIGCIAYAGEMDATVYLSGTDLKLRAADLNVSQVQIGDVNALGKYVAHDLTGSLSGRIHYEIDENKNTVIQGTLALQDFQIIFASPFHGLDQLNLDNIEADFESDRNQVKMNRFVNQGGDVDGSLSGTVLLRRRIEQSVLNLTGTVNPNPAFTDKLGRLGPIVRRMLKKSGGEGFPLKLQGTFERPRFF